MPIQPGSPAAQMPPGEDALIRRIQELERVVREILPSVASSIKPPMDEIRDLIDKIVEPGNVNISSGVTFTAGAYYDGVQTDVTVPADVTRLHVKANSGIYCAGNTNSTGGLDGTGYDAVYCRTVIGGVISAGFAQPVEGVVGFGSVYSSLATLFTGLTPGDTISFATQTHSASQNIPANASNKATLTALLTWLR